MNDEKYVITEVSKEGEASKLGQGLNKNDFHASNGLDEENDNIPVMQLNGTVQFASVVQPRSESSTNSATNLEENIEDLFRYIAISNSVDNINDNDMEKILEKINLRYGREYNREDALEFFNFLDAANNGVLNLNDFKRAFLNILQ